MYWGSDSSTRLTGSDPIASLEKTGADLPCDIPADTAIPSGAEYLLVYTKNYMGEGENPAALNLKDIICMEIIGGFSYRYPVVFNGKLYFSKYDSTYGRVLWEYDGTGVPVLVDDFNTNGSSEVESLVVFNNKLYFSAYDGTYGQELWVYDGVNDPEMARNIYTTYQKGSYPGYLTVYNDKLYFSATMGVGYELLIYDGSGLEYIDVNGASSTSSYPRNFTVFKEKLYFTAEHFTYDKQLWVYDEEDDPSLVAIINSSGDASPKYLTVSNDKLYFTATDGVNGRQIWMYDGVNDPVMLTDIESLDPSHLTVFNGMLYFSGFQSGFGRELWVYDWSDVTLIADMNDGYGSNPYGFFVYNDKLFFGAGSGYYGGNVEPWMYDGINPPQMIADLKIDGSSNPSNFIIYNDKLYFVANSGLWVYYEK